MKIDESLEKRINSLRERYPPYSREYELIVAISCGICRAAKSLIPDSELTVTGGYIEGYGEIREADNYLIGELREIVENAWRIYRDKTLEAAR